MKQLKSCPICNHSAFKLIDTITASNWNVLVGENLQREEHEFQIKECKYCGHMIYVGSYSEEMFSFLYSNNSESLTIKTRPWIFETIFNFTFPQMKIKDKIHLADFGGSYGSFLNNLISKLKASNCKIFADSYDLRIPNIEKGPIDFHSCNFNVIKDLKKNLQDFDFGFCIHTLEHLLKPREFLRALYTYNKRNFHLYIEVPANELLNKNHARSVGLIHPQHIHIFTKPNLEFMITTIGYSIVKSKYENKGDIPRIQLLIKKKNNNLKKIVKRFMDYKIYLLHKAAKIILKECSSKKKVAVWGIGQEFYNITKIEPNIVKYIQSGDLLLIDLNLARKSVFRTKIVHPKDIPVKLDKIIILPIIKHTRESIKSSALQLGLNETKIIIPYQ